MHSLSLSLSHTLTHSHTQTHTLIHVTDNPFIIANRPITHTHTHICSLSLFFVSLTLSLKHTNAHTYVTDDPFIIANRLTKSTLNFGPSPSQVYLSCRSLFRHHVGLFLDIM